MGVLGTELLVVIRDCMEGDSRGMGECMEMHVGGGGGGWVIVEG